MATGKPSAAARRAWTSLRSSRSGDAVDLDRLAVRAGGGEDRLEVDVVGLARAEAAPGGMHEHVHAGVAERAHDARGHLRARLLEARVHGGQHDVELGQHLVGEVERAVGQDVALGAGQDADAEARLQRRGWPRDLRAQLLHAEAAGDRRRARVVGDDDVLVAARLGGRRPASRASGGRPTSRCARAGRRGCRRR